MLLSNANTNKKSVYFSIRELCLVNADRALDKEDCEHLDRLSNWQSDGWLPLARSVELEHEYCID